MNHVQAKSTYDLMEMSFNDMAYSLCLFILTFLLNNVFFPFFDTILFNGLLD